MGSPSKRDCAFVFAESFAENMRILGIQKQAQIGPSLVSLERARVHARGKCPGCGSHETRPHKGGLICLYCRVER